MPDLTKWLDQWTHNRAYMLGILAPRCNLPSVFCFSLISKNVDPRACEMNVTNMMLSYLPERVK